MLKRFLVDISELKCPIGFIFYSFRVLISTTDLESMSFNGPIDMKIASVIGFKEFSEPRPLPA